MNFKDMSDAELGEAIDSMEQSYSEHYAECANERAMFGDSGPGSAILLREQLTSLNQAKDEWKRRHPIKVTPQPPTQACINGVDIPF